MAWSLGDDFDDGRRRIGSPEEGGRGRAGALCDFRTRLEADPLGASDAERGAAGLIGCTQPRRIAARSLATRLAHELPGTPKGFVSHKIRFQDRTVPETG